MLRFRGTAVSILFCALFFGGVFRLADLQINRSRDLLAFRDNRLSQVEQKAPRRGRILDASGNIVAEDRPTQDIWLIPARFERINRRRTVVSNLEPISAEHLLFLAGRRGEEGEFELNLAIAGLSEANALVAEVAARLGMDRRETAGKILSAAISGSPASIEELANPRPLFQDTDFALALSIRAALANPYEREFWRALTVRTGGRRHYPAGSLLAHVTGAVGKLTAEEYRELRGDWTDDEAVPGKGVVHKQGRIFFSMADSGGGLSDEERILRLREVKRSGKLVRTRGYLLNEMVGRGGLEQHYNQALRGRHRLQSLRLARDSASGRRRFVPTGGMGSAVNGADIRIGIRIDTQRRVREILERHIKAISGRPELVSSGWIPSGIAIMMDPRTGRIHAMVSLPSYDPNTLGNDFALIRDDPANPLLDRTIAAIYPPGSVAKPLVGLAALAEDAVMPGQHFFCDRVLTLAGARFTCLGRHGGQDIESALMNSCNIFFYHAGEALGSRKLYEWYARLGLGHRTGIDMAGESPGILPRNAYTRRGWATGNTYHMSIGKGLAVTPLQVAVLHSAIAASEGGILRVPRPHLLLPPARPPETAEEEDLAAEAMDLERPVSESMVDREALAIIRQGMWEVVQGKPETGAIGTGWQASFPLPGGGFLIEIGGKTGTAEWSTNVGGNVRKRISHVWFAAFAPFDHPEVAVVVMLPEAGGGGGGTCAPIAKDLLRMWFNLPERMEDAANDREALG
ncbi:MAG: hypothetical protein LBE84_02610 [Planctomycetota bacterium]|jgi:penicillin-binding protein 2|nr:hypothetical protein [Planctomycetota bacterium]